MMKIFRLVGIVLAICLMCGAFVACNNGGGDETTTEAVKTITVNVEIYEDDNVSGKAKYEGVVTYEGNAPTAYDILDWFCTVEEDIAFEATKDKTVTRIGDIVIESPSYLSACYKNKGINNSFEKLTTQNIDNGTTVIFYVK